MLQQHQNLACRLFPLTCACSTATVQQGQVECAFVDEDGSEAQPETAWKDDGSLPLDSQGQLPFFLLDAHEETSTPGLVHLFGKVNTLIPCLLSPCYNGLVTMGKLTACQRLNLLYHAWLRAVAMLMQQPA